MNDNDFAGLSEKDKRLEAMAFDAVLRRASAETYQARAVQLQTPDGEVLWTPEAQACHSNVQTWIRHSPADKWVKGFLLDGPFYGCWRVLAHSLIQLEDGSLIDITPRGGNQPFVRHVGTDDEFFEYALRVKLIVRP
jgi:hypothetical protein